MNARLQVRLAKPRPTESLGGALVDLVALLMVLASYGLAFGVVAWGAR